MRLAPILLLAATSLAGCGRTEPPHPLEAAGFSVRTYRSVPGRELRMFLRSPERSAAPRPLVLMFHGGGWVAGAPQELAPFCVALAREGFVAATAEYRLARRISTVFDAVEDARAALAYVRSHARELGADPRRIFLMGGSAGGHLAYFASRDIPLPAGAVLMSSVADTSIESCGRDLMGPRWRELSPLHTVTPRMPRLLFLHSREDRVVPFEGISRLVERLRSAGVEASLVADGVEHHGFYVVESADDLPERSWFREILAFLRE